jgi:hypothetical protein
VEESWLAHAKMAGSERTCHELAKSVPILTPLLKNSKVSGIGLAPCRSLTTHARSIEDALGRRHELALPTFLAHRRGRKIEMEL